MPLDEFQRASKAQFSNVSQNYGRRHSILADTSDVDRALDGLEFERGAQALDIACGGGHLSLALARRGCRVTLADLSREMLIAAGALLVEEGFTPSGSFVCPAEQLPFDEGSFAVVGCRIAPHHFSDPQAYVRESARVLQRGGLFLLIDGTVPEDSPETDIWLNTVEKWRDPSHGRLLARAEWEDYATAANLDVVRAEIDTMRLHDLEWYFETARTPEGNREKVREAVAGASEEVRRAMQIASVDGKTTWLWPRLTLLARKG